MLETIRNNTRSLLIYLVFGILIAVFIINFGPQAGSRQGCGSQAVAAARVNGHEVSDTSWRYGILAFGQGSASGERARKAQVRERVLDRLFVRELLADLAANMGFRISDKEMRQRIVAGEIYILGEKLDGKRIYYLKGEGDDEPHFSARALDAFVKNLGVPNVDRFGEEQKRELAAQTVRDLVATSIRVSPEEVQHQYELESSKVEIEYVPFSTASYRQSLEATSADIDAYLKAHEADLKAQYDKEADRWKGREKEVRVRDLFVKSEQPPTEPPADGKPAPKPPTKPDPARAKAVAALAKIKGGQDFAQVVKSVTPDAKRGGDLGWRSLRALRLGAPVADAVAKLDKGQVSDVIATPDGFHVVQLLDKREGDLAFDAVKRDLAESALYDEQAKAAAKADADKALAAAQGGTPLEKQYPPEGSDTPAAGGKPRLQKSTDVRRVGGYIPGIGTAPELTKALFDEVKVGDLAPQVYEVSGDYFVVRLTKRDEPDMQKFQTEKRKLAAELQQRKAFEAVATFESRHCLEARARGAIQFDAALVHYSDAAGTPVKMTYAPCQTLR